MQFNNPATELTTAGTDALLALVCVCLIAGHSGFRAHLRWKTRLWSWVLGLLALASFLGANAHGFDLSPAMRNFLWQPGNKWRQARGVTPVFRASKEGLFNQAPDY
jgi:hypothetical protein